MSRPLNAFWTLVRPFHRAFTTRLRKRLGRNYADHPEMALPPPYEALQLDVERNLHNYLHVKREAVENIVLVGAHDANELPRMKRSYPEARFVCFEANPAAFGRLSSRYGRLPYVRLVEAAISDHVGNATFFELPADGNGSLLAPDIEEWTRANKMAAAASSSYEVKVDTLDRALASSSKIDLLWVDVQGAEAKVLAGAVEVLRETQAVFIEIAVLKSPYRGAALFQEIQAVLEGQGFFCAGIGLDSWNFCGNAFFLRGTNRHCIEPR